MTVLQVWKQTNTLTNRVYVNMSLLTYVFTFLQVILHEPFNTV